MKIPFKWTPASWGLKGKEYNRAEACYDLTGADLDLRLADIDNEHDDIARQREHIKIKLRYGMIDAYEHDIAMAELEPSETKDLQRLIVDRKHGKIDQYAYEIAVLELNTVFNSIETDRGRLDIDLKHGKIDLYTYEKAVLGLTVTDPIDYDRGLLEIDHKHGAISDYDYKVKIANLDHTGTELKIALLGIDLDADKIEQHDHDKQVATLRNEPYVGVIGSDYDSKQGVNGLYFELAWNDQFVQLLSKNGYSGYTDEEVVDKWFSAVCRAISENNEEPADTFVATSTAYVRTQRLEDGKTVMS